MKFKEAEKILAQIQYKPNWKFKVDGVQVCHKTRTWVKQATYMWLEIKEPDIESDTLTSLKTRKWEVVPEADETWLIHAAFRAILNAEEHEAHERFMYKGQRPFYPHGKIE